jgi:hypothetical protein
MSKFAKIFAITALLTGAVAVTPGVALAQHHGGHGGGFHGGGFHGGGFRGGGFGRGFGLGVGYPYYYGGYGYGGGDCGWTRVRVWRGGYWGFRRAWRCW